MLRLAIAFALLLAGLVPALADKPKTEPKTYAPEAIATAPAPVAGQGIAWDRTEKNVIWGIVRDKVKGENRVTATRVPALKFAATVWRQRA